MVPGVLSCEACALCSWLLQIPGTTIDSLSPAFREYRTARFQRLPQQGEHDGAIASWSGVIFCQCRQTLQPASAFSKLRGKGKEESAQL